jgi:hypothetical protein
MWDMGKGHTILVGKPEEEATPKTKVHIRK